MIYRFPNLAMKEMRGRQHNQTITAKAAVTA
jgi:hypothetical protein